MMGFTLSKINLLIFVLAIAAIILFFSSSLSDIMVSLKSQEVVKRLVENSKTILGSPTTCDSVVLHVPKYIDIFSASAESGGSGISSFAFFIELQKVLIDEDDPENKRNQIVFTIYRTSRPDYILGSGSFITRPGVEVHLWKKEGREGWLESSEKFVLNPNAYPNPEDTIIIIKEGLVNPKLYIFPCPRDEKICQSFQDELGKKIQEGGFICPPYRKVD